MEKKKNCNFNFFFIFRIIFRFKITKTGSQWNFTRSYYMNHGDYIISGSCEESIVRILCSKTGKLLSMIQFQEDIGGDSFACIYFMMLLIIKFFFFKIFNHFVVIHFMIFI